MKRMIITLLVLVGCQTFLLGADWGYWRGPLHTGVSTETDWSYDWPQAGPKALWEAQVGIGFASITVADGRAYTMGHQDKQDVVTCLDALTGKVLWTHKYPEPKKPNLYEGGPNATPTIDEGKVYTISKTGKVFCLQADKGTVLWARDIQKEYGVEKPEWGFASSPLIINNVVYLNAGAAGMALKSQDGSLLWKNGAKPAGYASLVPYRHNDELRMVVFSGVEVVGVKAATGDILWRHKWKTSYNINAADPLMIGNRVFISSGYGTGCGLLEINDRQVKEIYRSKTMRNQCYGSVLYKGYVYGFDGQVNKKGKLTCLDPQTGDVKWQQDGFGTGTVLVAGDKLIVLGERGKLVIAQAQPNAFKQLAEAQILNEKCWTVPALANGLLYARDAQGRLVCLDLR